MFQRVFQAGKLWIKGMAIWDFKCIALCLLTAASLCARAGGGEDFGGGGGGDGGGSSGGGSGFSGGGSFSSDRSYDGGGQWSNEISPTSNGHSIIGILIVLFLIMVIWYYLNKRSKGSGFATPSSQLPSLRHGSLFKEKAKSNSPEATLLLTALPNHFVCIQKAWGEGRMDSAHRLLSDGIFSRLQSQIDMHAREGIHNHVASIQLIDAEIIGDHSDDGWHSIDVLIHGSMADWNQPKGETPERPNGLQASTFNEIWSFIRRTQTPKGTELDSPIKGTSASEPALGYDPNHISSANEMDRCLACGASLQNNADARCGHCGALLNSGTLDFVLCEISQPSAWRPRANTTYGLAQSQQPQTSGMPIGFHPQVLEDRASLVAVRIFEAVSLARPLLLAPFADETCLVAFSKNFAELNANTLHRLAFGRCDVRQVHQHATPESSLVTAQVEVRYAARDSAHSKTPRQASLFLSFERKTEGLENEHFATLSCAACGAPMQTLEAPKCPYCGATYALPDAAWTLTQISNQATV